MTDAPQPILKPRRGKRAAAVLILVFGGLFAVSACQDGPPKKKGPPHKWGEVEMFDLDLPKLKLPHIHWPD